MWFFRSTEARVKDKLIENLKPLIKIVNKDGELDLDLSDHRSAEVRAEWWKKGGPFNGIEHLMIKKIFKGTKSEIIASEVMSMARGELDLGIYKAPKSSKKNKLECSYAYLLRSHIELRKTLRGGSDLELRNMLLRIISQEAIIDYLVKRHSHSKRKHLLKFLIDMVDKKVLTNDSRIGNKTFDQIADLKGFEKLKEPLMHAAQKEAAKPDEINWVG